MAKVLVVDDDAANRDLVATLLGYRKHEVVEASDGAQGLAVARRESPDLVITDLLMPVMDGYELIREMRADAALASTPAIFYTANYLENEVRPFAKTLGVGHIVSKPIDPQHLLRTVDEALLDRVTTHLVPREAFAREHQRTLSAKLIDKVHQLERAEAALRESESRFRSLAEFSPVGICSMTPEGAITYANPRMVEICGGVDGDMDTVRWGTLARPDDRDRVLAAVARAIDTGTPQIERACLELPDTRPRWVQMWLAPVDDQSGQPGIVAAVEDVTAVVEAQHRREELEQRLRTSDRLESLGELAAGIAHDFNNLLSVIVNYSEFLALGLDEVTDRIGAEAAEQLRADTAVIHSAADRAADLTRRLLVFARRDTVRTELVDVNAVARESISLLARTIGGHITIVDELDAAPHQVIADRTQIEQVIMNLIVNARDAITMRGTVTVTTEIVDVDETTPGEPRPGRYTRLRVRDDGAGMDADTRVRVFEPFFTTKPIGKGTGLGLSTVYGVVTRLGGSVAIDSAPGCGTTVSVYLPLAVDAVPEPVEPAPDSAPNGAGEVVLVCDDHPEVVAMAARALAAHGYQPVVVERPALAVELLDGPQPVDLLLTEVVMSEMSGRELADRARANRPDLPVLFMSGYAGDVLDPASEAARELLLKPFTRTALLEAVGRRLRSAG
ncbi:MAG TPA: response regulator [Jatrophihabitans sp.]|jgi:hypothetical protein|uniref:ATP-binding response regulator n=1 Tax=Jatrophihabitans sp. TaxID=1932789 RepID=UPI002DFD05E5|nr:response regulator [Jatrophihabitans sp.]